MCAQDNVINMIINIKKDDNHDHEHKKKATVAIRMEKVKTTIRSMKRQQSQLRHKNHWPWSIAYNKTTQDYFIQASAPNPRC
jgi:hypothetical protein